ncbi:MAG: T9SS type A sorting domain-containing protein [Bacteroidota bacterium]|nr:T9SS type A sorting domain-containing protein [Bacteroidota bacterium]
MKRRLLFLWWGIATAILSTAVLAQEGALNTIGGFESSLPSYWTIGNQPSGSTVSWATDQYRSLGHSLKITKSTTSDSASWVSENMCDLWSPQHYKNVDILLGAYVKTSGVNTNPASNDAKWYIAYTFYDSAGALIGQTKLPVNQSVGTSSGWVADTNDVGATILPRDAWKTIVSFVGGKNATGTVWADDFIFTGRGGAWAGQDWNTSVGVPTGWYYWLPPNGGNDGMLSNGFENTLVTNETAHSGQYSLKFVLPANRQPHDAFVGTRRFLLNGTGTLGTSLTSVQQLKQDVAGTLDAKPGDILRISVWIKASGLVPDSAAKYPDTWSVGLTPGFFKDNGNNTGYNPIQINDYMFTFPAVTSFDWTQYYLDVKVPSDPTTNTLEVRLHVYNRFVGTVYFDDLKVEKVGETTTGVKRAKDGIPDSYELANNYPNPFNPSTTIGFGVPQSGVVSVTIYNILGQKVRTLLNGFATAGEHSIVWDGRNDAGIVVESGVYFYRLETAGGMSLVRKMLLLK